MYIHLQSFAEYPYMIIIHLPPCFTAFSPISYVSWLLATLLLSRSSASGHHRVRAQPAWNAAAGRGCDGTAGGRCHCHRCAASHCDGRKDHRCPESIATCKNNTWIILDLLQQKASWLVVSTPLKHISQLGWLFPKYGKLEIIGNLLVFSMTLPQQVLALRGIGNTM